MRNHKKIRRTTQILESITCDVCKTTHSTDEMYTDEFFSFNSIGGYTSVFGDGNQIEIDVCQDCFKKLLGNYARINHE